METASKVLIAAGLCSALACSSSPASVRRSWPTMGTYATVTVTAADRDVAERTVAATRAVFDRVETTMSNWSTESELSRLNREAGRAPYRIQDGDLAACIEAALAGADRTGGTFDPTVGPLMTAWGFRPKAPRVPSDEELLRARSRVGAGHVRYDARSSTIRFDRPGLEIDLGGIAKGCALDVVRRAVERDERVLAVELDLGGQWAFLRAAGRSMGIADPAARDRVIASVSVGAGDSIATSSNSESHFEAAGVRYGHIMDPRTGRPAVTDVLQATVIDPSATTAEVLGKALLVGGSARAVETLRLFPEAKAVLVVRDGSGVALLATESLLPHLASELPRRALPAANMPGLP